MSQLLKLSDDTESRLREKAREHNATGTERRITIEHLKAVYRRGAQMFPAQERYNDLDSFAMLRVDAFLGLLAHDNPARARYRQDFDLLPASHPMVASGNVDRSGPRNHLAVSVIPESEVSSPEHAIFNLAEISGQGYEIIPALRAAWTRGSEDSRLGTPYERAYRLATDPSSPDTDLLPKK